jgi:hypothetical protein
LYQASSAVLHCTLLHAVEATSGRCELAVKQPCCRRSERLYEATCVELAGRLLLYHAISAALHCTLLHADVELSAITGWVVVIVVRAVALADGLAAALLVTAGAVPGAGVSAPVVTVVVEELFAPQPARNAAAANGTRRNMRSLGLTSPF